jgi:hypothetical protein
LSKSRLLPVFELSTRSGFLPPWSLPPRPPSPGHSGGLPAGSRPFRLSMLVQS